MTKILSNHLASFIGSYVQKDQVGFIPGRQGPDQIRRAVDLISLMKSSCDGGSPQKGFLLSIDFQKAFDTVSWPYLFTTLKRWGFGPNFLKTLEALYSYPKAQVRLQGYYSATFPIEKGMRQGCSLSPLLFAIAIETLAISIRLYPDMHGVQCGQSSHKCALFVDDILLFVTSPLIRTPNILQLLHKFEQVSGLHVNMAKSKTLNISTLLNLVDRLKSYFPFSWSYPFMPYLGIHLTASIDLLSKNNYPLMFKKLSADLSQWFLYGMSWVGRVNAIKMTLLPQILYLFRSLPIPVTKLHINKLQSAIIRFMG